jgi:hypothetical protein
MAKEIKLTEEQQTAVKACVTMLEKDDQYIRERNIRTWKKAEEYWRLNQYIYWSEVALDYRNITNFQEPTGNDDDNESVPPKTFAIYRAYGESVIAAMAATIPSVLFFPDDADNPDDINTAKAYSLISELIQKHSRAPLLFIHILTLLYNQGLVATYTSWDDDEKYGSVKIPNFTNEQVKMQEIVCPQCQSILANSPIQDESSQENADDQLTKEEQSQVTQEKPLEQIYHCSNCGYEGQAEAGEVFDETIPRLTGYSDTPKGRISIQSFGPLNVRISSYAKTVEDVGLLELQLEMHYAAARDEFPEIADKIRATSDFYSYERWGRTSSELLSDQLFNQVTVRYCWVRQWGFEAFSGRSGVIDSDTTIKDLKKKFPHGCCAIFVNDIFARAYDESLDDHWSITVNPLDSFIHGIPIGRAALDVQDAYNEVKNLGLQKHQFGIAETFVDGSVIDEESYRQQMAGPGYVTFANAPQGQALAQSFFQTRTAAMNEEDTELAESLNSDAQFLLGAVPSIFGGSQVSGSKTATEYNQSRNFALQRLGNHWTNIKYLWAETLGKACRLFATKMVEDEKFVRQNGNSFETVWIRQAELTGKVGNVEPDPSEQFPLTWAQKRDLFMQMITMQNPVIGQIMLHPNNAQNTKDALGFPEFYIPGEEDRSKQLIELRKLSLVDADQLPPDAQQSTVPIDPDVDDDNVHIMVIKLWCVSAEGLYLKETNPVGYMNVILHLREHVAHLQSMQPPQPQQQQQQKQPPQGNKQPSQLHVIHSAGAPPPQPQGQQ